MLRKTFAVLTVALAMLGVLVATARPLAASPGPDVALAPCVWSSVSNALVNVSIVSGDTLHAEYDLNCSAGMGFPCSAYNVAWTVWSYDVGTCSATGTTWKYSECVSLSGGAGCGNVDADETASTQPETVTPALATGAIYLVMFDIYGNGAGNCVDNNICIRDKLFYWDGYEEDGHDGWSAVTACGYIQD